MRHQELLDALRALKGTNAWHEIAERAGVSYFTLQRIVSTERSPRIGTVEAIADALAAWKAENKATA